MHCLTSSLAPLDGSVGRVAVVSRGERMNFESFFYTIHFTFMQSLKYSLLLESSSEI